LHDSYIPNSWKTVSTIVFAGEALTKSHVEKALQLFSKNDSNTKVKILNMYGPAECTIASKCFLVPDSIETYFIPIGKPLANYKCFVLNSSLEQVPINEIGELYIGGKSLMQKYYGNPKQTRERLLYVNKYNQTLYKTGDLVKILNDGNIEYVGRTDFQVKIRGQRLEIGEIENVIMKHPQVTGCVIQKHYIESDEHLVAYVETQNKDIKEKLICDCKEYLRNYMVPTIWMMMDKFPLNKNGKVDRNQLPTPIINKTKSEIMLPSTEIEKKIHDIWSDVLKQEQINIIDDFFSVGGTSLTAISIMSKINKEYNSINIEDFFKHSSIKEISDFISQNKKEETYTIKKLNHKEGSISHAQNRILLDEIVRFNSETTTIYNIASSIRINTNNTTKIIEGIKHIVNRHEILRTYFISNDGKITQRVLEDINIDLQILNDANYQSVDGRGPSSQSVG
jgi:hypothetical protein